MENTPYKIERQIFDPNNHRRMIEKWVRVNPDGTTEELGYSEVYITETEASTLEIRKDPYALGPEEFQKSQNPALRRDFEEYTRQLDEKIQALNYKKESMYKSIKK